MSAQYIQRTSSTCPPALCPFVPPTDTVGLPGQVEVFVTHLKMTTFFCLCRPKPSGIFKKLICTPLSSIQVDWATFRAIVPVGSCQTCSSVFLSLVFSSPGYRSLRVTAPCQGEKKLTNAERIHFNSHALIFLVRLELSNGELSCSPIRAVMQHALLTQQTAVYYCQDSSWKHDLKIMIIICSRPRIVAFSKLPACY